MHLGEIMLVKNLLESNCLSYSLRILVRARFVRGRRAEGIPSVCKNRNIESLYLSNRFRYLDTISHEDTCTSIWVR